MFGEENEEQYLDDMQREKLLYEVMKAMQAPMLDMMRMQLEGGLSGTQQRNGLGSGVSDQSTAVERGTAESGSGGSRPVAPEPGMAPVGPDSAGVSGGGIF
jgi:hypothetical protein